MVVPSALMRSRFPVGLGSHLNVGQGEVPVSGKRLNIAFLRKTSCDELFEQRTGLDYL